MSKDTWLLTITSVLAVLFATCHLADDIVRGFAPGGMANITFIVMTVVWLYGALVLVERRSGHVIILLGSILGSGIPILHMRGAGMVGGRIANANGKFFWVFTLLTVGAISALSVILSIRGLWRLSRK
jgi:hypothetical protein